MQSSESSQQVLSLSPSFNAYSSGTLAQIAARVVQEFRAESQPDNHHHDDVFNFKDEQSSINKPHTELLNNTKEDDFEFAFTFGHPDSPTISADDIFSNGQIRPIFPLFNTDLLLGNAEFEISKSSKPPPPQPPPAKRPARLPLRKLFIEERDTPSCSSSEADNLDGIQPETYCVWRPRIAPEEDSPEKCKKSNSTGSSKRWKFRDLLHRSNSDGKDSLVFMTPKEDKEVKDTGSVKEGGSDDVTATAENHVKKIGMKEGDRRRSLIPYKQDLVGLFANVSGLSRNIHPF
ncbi:hypothetical protein LguiA_009493 [Lonicera macranthoides]